MEKSDFIFGIRAVIEAVNSGKTIDKLLIKTGIKGELVQELYTIIKENDLHAQSVPEQKLNRVTRKNHQGVIAFISPIPFYNIEEIVARTYEEGKTPFFLVLDGITDIRNFGAIARTAECTGVDAIIIPDKGAAQINGDAVKTSAGALHHMPICKVKSLLSTVRYLKESGIKVFAATEKAVNVYTAQDYSVPTAIIMGSEDVGISNQLLTNADELIKLPILGKIQSLNVSVAAGVLMYEVVRSRPE